MDFTLIEDIRENSAFSGRTFSGCSKTESERDLIASLSRGDIETSIYRSADLLSAGHVWSTWDVFIDFFCKHIGTCNPGIILFLAKKQERMIDLLSSLKNNTIELRNAPLMRNTFGEVCSVLCLSPKKMYTPGASIHAASEFRLDVLSQRVEATSETFIYSVMEKDDSPEIHIPINELGYHLNTVPKNFSKSSYWIEWILEYDHLCKQNKDKCVCSERSSLMSHLTSEITTNGKQHVVWVIWQLFLIECQKRNTAAVFFSKIVLATMKVFGHKFTNTTPRKRKSCMLFIVALLCEDVAPKQCQILPPEKVKIVQQTINPANTIINDIYVSLCKDQIPVAPEDACYMNF